MDVFRTANRVRIQRELEQSGILGVFENIMLKISAYENEKQEDGPVLEIYGTDLTALARQGKLEECFGREKELLELMEILVRRQKNNPLFLVVFFTKLSRTFLFYFF